MTAILYFFTDDGKTLVIVLDRQVTYEYELREENKFFRKGRFYIFCAGSKDVYNNIVLDISSNRSDITKLAKFVDQRNKDIVEKLTKMGLDVGLCSFLIVDSKDLKARVVNRGTVSEINDFGIIGIGENHTQEIYEIFFEIAPEGFQLKAIRLNEIVYQKIIQAYHKLALKELTVFKKNKKQQFKVTYKHPINELLEYDLSKVRS